MKGSSRPFARMIFKASGPLKVGQVVVGKHDRGEATECRLRHRALHLDGGLHADDAWIEAVAAKMTLQQEGIVGTVLHQQHVEFFQL